MHKQQAKAAMNESLCDFASRWKMDGDYLRCVKCKRPIIASRTDLAFSHADGCKNASTSEPHPWLTLVGILRPIMPQPPSASDERKGFEQALIQNALTENPGMGLTVQRLTGWRGPNGDYATSPRLAAMWWAWQARAALAPSPGVDAAERKILYTVKVSGAFQTFSRTVHSLSLVEGEYDLYAGAYREPHPPSRDCMCAACRPSFDNDADDPARRYDITRGGANG